MQITPAILTSDLVLFSNLAKKLEFVETLDVDICRSPFVDNVTVQLDQVVDLIDFEHQSIGFHLMVDNPEQDLMYLLNSIGNDQSVRVYLHQESNLNFLAEFEWPGRWSRCLAIKFESEFKNIEFYNNFDEIQLMSIETGKQGNSFKPSVITRIEGLTKLGYFGKISIDGGINMNTIELIKDLPIDRISVGSYFQKSQNVRESYRIMHKALEK